MRETRLLLSVLVIFLSRPVMAAEYRLSMLPLYGTKEINNRIKPLAAYLEQQTGLKIEAVLTADFSQYGQQLSSGVIHIGYENPYVYINNTAAHEVIAMASTDGTGYQYRGIIITRTDSHLRTLQALKGERISIVSRSSSGGFMSQSLTLWQNGINVLQDCIVEEATENKQENVIFSVYTGDVAAGFIRESALSEVKEFVPEDAIRVLSHTAWLPNWALSLSRKIPAEDKEKLVQAIARLKPGHPALQALKVDEFRIAADSEYNPAREAAAITQQ